MSVRISDNHCVQQSAAEGDSLVQWAGRKISDAIPQIATNLNRVAIPTVLWIGACSMTGVEAGPLAYAACCAACGTVTGVSSAGTLLPMSVGLCIKACLPVYFAPSP